MYERQIVKTETAKKWAKENDFVLFKEISALNGENMDNLINEIGQLIFDHRREIVSYYLRLKAN